MKKVILRYIVVGVMLLILVGSFLFMMFGSAAWFIGHYNGEAYNTYEASMLENGMHPDIYGYGWTKE